MRKKQSNKRKVTSLDAIIGNRIRARRLELRASQSDLADKLGVSFQQVQKYEKGVNRVGAGRLQQIAKVLETDMQFFMGDLGGDSKKPPTVSRFATFMATKDGAAIIEAMIRLDHPELRRSVIDLARRLGSVYGEAEA